MVFKASDRAAATRNVSAVFCYPLDYHPPAKLNWIKNGLSLRKITVENPCARWESTCSILRMNYQLLTKPAVRPSIAACESKEEVLTVSASIVIMVDTYGCSGK
jgi:hypothetical protein